MKLFSLLPALLAVGTAVAADAWSFKDASVAVVSKSAKGGFKESFTPSKPLSTEIVLHPLDTLKLLLTTLSNSTPARPHQAHLLLTHPSGLSTALPLLIKPSGRALLTLTPSDLPLSLLSTPLSASLAIGSFNTTLPLHTEIFTLRISAEKDAQLPTYDAPERYAQKPQIHHVFRAEPAQAPKAVSLLFTLIIVSTIPVLFGIWLALGSNLNGLAGAMKTAPVAHVLFFGSLLAMEGVFAMYYLSWRLFRVLPVAGAVGVLACISGAKALSEVQKRRIGGQR